MPSYEFRCATCGPFQIGRALDQAGDPCLCPRCFEAAKRVFTPPSLTIPRGALRHASKTGRRTIDRALSGEPTTTGGPTGRRLPSAGHSH
ncbi:FmdB family zinc ribbon protein [Aeromicrobium yanjiei]|uniref:Putative regulatory protein FmdB zinc ribbon domain-containing protein n=1 Tax=Aeromicrobium yanjiei TaxID=2662028 RepID=A0A5Q2ML58_9ACTN|nr:hypothetical protein GEV26_10875 [Aeromicrobium yanjiei]